ncbi:MAG TPA: hypothetical protein VGT61_08160 [Thermomicrobiales bacterium]|nr:hypothetical protein [Thermomicrobiales bacterium]
MIEFIALICFALVLVAMIAAPAQSRPVVRAESKPSPVLTRSATQSA